MTDSLVTDNLIARGANYSAESLYLSIVDTLINCTLQ